MTTTAPFTKGLAPRLAVAFFITLAVTAASGSARAAPLDPVNLALGKPARQSSTLFDAGANRAVDGNADGTFWNGSVTHTNNDLHSWWEVDLGEVRSLDRIEIANRSDCCADRLLPFVAIVADFPLIDADITDADASLFPGVMRTTLSWPTQASYTIPINRTGRYVRIALLNQNFLSLSEVRVIESMNAARFRVASQSSTRPDGHAERAIDGNRSGVFASGSVSATNVEPRPWWQIDLRELRYIDEVDIWIHNTDCCSSTDPSLGFYVWFSDSPIIGDPFSQFIPGVTGMHVQSQATPVVVRPSPTRLARYVRVQLDSYDALSLAEVEVRLLAGGAIGGHAKTSSAASGSNPNSAIDLNTLTPVVTQTQNEPYLDVDLGGVRYIETVKLWSASPASAPAKYNLFVSNTDFVNGTTPVTTVAGTRALGGVSSWIGRGTSPSSTTAVMRSGRFIRVMLDGQSSLALTELEIGATQGYASSSLNNGGIVLGNPPTATVSASGYYPRPNTPITIYAFRPSTSGSGGTYQWIGNATTASQPVMASLATAPTYFFTAPNLTIPAGTFTTGGMGGLFYQASDISGAFVPLRTVDALLDENPFWPHARLVSVQTTPDDLAVKPPYLESPHGTGLEIQYTGWGNFAVPSQFTTFASMYFSSNLTDVSGTGMAPGPLMVSYYNGGELGLGRRVTCVRAKLPYNKSGSPPATRNGTACSVEEYAPLDGNGKPIFGDQAGALNALFASAFSISTIVRYDSGEIWFGSYKRQTDGTYKREKTGAFDSTGHNTSVPNNCMACHGGSGSRHDPSNLSAPTGGFLLPFDVTTFAFGTATPGHTYEAQVESFRKLNDMVAKQNVTPQIKEFVEGTYNNAAHVPGTLPNLKWIPAGWRTTPGQVKVYDEVIKPFCRACHNSQTPAGGGVDFRKATDAENMRALIIADVCQSHRMPHAQHTMKRFWKSGARAQLLGFFGRHDYNSEKCVP